MERNQELFEKIEQYLKGELSSEEHMEFEQEISSSPDLRQEVELHNSLQEELENSTSMELRKKLARIHGELKLTKNKKGAFRWRIAAGFAVLIGLSIFLWAQMRPISTADEIYDSYYISYPMEDVVRGGANGLRDKTLRQYSDGSYLDAIPGLNELVANHPEQSVFKLYLGCSLLNTDQEMQALNLFKTITVEDKYYEDAQWYHALSYLKLGQRKKAITILESVIQYNGIHQRNAEKLIHEIKD